MDTLQSNLLHISIKVFSARILEYKIENDGKNYQQYYLLKLLKVL